MNQPVYDLEERTFLFAKNVRMFLKTIVYRPLFESDLIQLVKSSGSVGANYIEANEALGKKDFLMKLKICRKEAKESVYWLKMLKNTVESIDMNTMNILIDESTQLKKIFSSIIDKSK